MPSLREWWDELWDNVQHSPTMLPTRHVILPDHVDKQLGERFKRDQHYFVVKVNRVFLQYNRQFWATYAPMALVVSEFQYDQENIVVPFVVGPSLLEKDRIELPNGGFMFLDTKVAGVHPYKGGGLKLTVILYQVKRSDLAKRLLKVAENVASVLDFSQTLSTYLKIANVLVDTIGDVIGTDPNNRPIIGLRQEFEAGDDFKPGYFAMIASDKINRGKLWVKENELLYGDTANAPKFTDANYVLYSIGQTTERDDFEALSPIGEMWKQVRTEATRTKAETWDTAKVAMSTLYQAMILSPDLTEGHANQLNDELVTRMVRMHERALQNVSHGEVSTQVDPLEKVRQKALDILKL
jgi:hypothetical protein